MQGANLFIRSGQGHSILSVEEPGIDRFLQDNQCYDFTPTKRSSQLCHVNFGCQNVKDNVLCIIINICVSLKSGTSSNWQVAY